MQRLLGEMTDMDMTGEMQAKANKRFEIERLRLQ